MVAAKQNSSMFLKIERSCSINRGFGKKMGTAEINEKQANGLRSAKCKFSWKNTLKYNIIRRVLLTIVMLASFAYLIRKDKVFIAILILLIQFFAFKEVISVAFIRKKMTLLSKYLVFHFFVAANIFLLHKSIMGIFGKMVHFRYKRFYGFFGFFFYIMGFCLFTYSLRRKSLKKQFYSFGITHLTTILLCKAVQITIFNLGKGKFWFVFPAILVISNDIAAYVVGKCFGKRPLLKISPKKTREGFVGGILVTTIVGLIIAYATLRFRLVGDVYFKMLSEPFVVDFLGFQKEFSAIYLHSFFFIFFASFIAPFGGFFASGYKRAFGVKDFGTIIPGHGGMLDRMDCQFLMAFFTNVYINTFLNTNILTVEDIVLFVRKKLDEDQIKDLVRALSS